MQRMHSQKTLQSWRSAFGHCCLNCLAHDNFTINLCGPKVNRAKGITLMKCLPLKDSKQNVTLQAVFGGGSSSFRRFLEDQLAAPAVSELFAGSAATHILPATLRCGPQLCSLHYDLGNMS